MLLRLIAVISVWLASSGSAYAVFSIAPPEGTVSEPASAALMLAGAVVVGGLRYLGKRKGDK